MVTKGQVLYDVLPPSGQRTQTTVPGGTQSGDPGNQPLVAPSNAPDMSPDPGLPQPRSGHLVPDGRNRLGVRLLVGRRRHGPVVQLLGTGGQHARILAVTGRVTPGSDGGTGDGPDRAPGGETSRDPGTVAHFDVDADADAVTALLGRRPAGAFEVVVQVRGRIAGGDRQRPVPR